MVTAGMGAAKMPAQHQPRPDHSDRPFNNLLRRLNASDFGLIAPHLAQQELKANELLYNPGDDVEVVHFPCGPSLATFMVPNADGRDVETILVGREGAVGGIVSKGFLPAYTRIMVKFGGPFVRLHVGKLEAAKLKSATLRNVFARYADCMLAQIFQSTACNAIHSIEQRTAKWIISAMERTDDDNTVPLTHEQLATLLGVGRSYTSRVIQTFKAEGVLETRRGSILVRNPDALRMQGLQLQRSRQKPLRGSAARGLSDRSGSYPLKPDRFWRENQLTKAQTTHCFPAISDYIAPQRAGCARSFWPGFLFGRRAPFRIPGF